MMNYTLYMHITSSGKRYIGITKQKPKKRWLNGCGYSRNKHFHRAIKKYGWDNIEHKVLSNWLSKEEAEKKEKECIKHYKSNNRKYGYNLTNGGGLGKECSIETRIKMSEAKKGMQPPFNGSMLNEAQRKAISKRLSKAVRQYSLDGIFIKEYASVKQASEAFGTNVSKCLVKKKQIAYKYYWSYSKENISQEEIKQFVKEHEKKVNEHFQRLSKLHSGRTFKRTKENMAKHEKKVCQFDLDGLFIREHESIRKAGISVNAKSDASISMCCSGRRKTAYGYKCEYAEKETK